MVAETDNNSDTVQVAATRAGQQQERLLAEEALTSFDDWLSSSNEAMPVTRQVCEYLRHHLDSADSEQLYLFRHALVQAQLLADLELDDETLAAALLASVVGSDEYRLKLAARFSATVAALLAGLMRMPSVGKLLVSHSSRQESHQQAEQLRKMLLAMAADVRVVLLRLADRVVRLRQLGRCPREQQQRLAAEVIEIDAPLANRLGIWQLKWELEDLSLRYLEPKLYHRIASLLAERRVDRDRYIAELVERLRQECQKAGVKNAEISGRAKHIYSIWRKMERKQINYHDLYDVRGIRILVEDVQACYTVLGTIHSLWQYIPGEFDDYIATPKENGYRSIHTAVVGPHGKVVEIQLRTYQMHAVNELGVAAHWRYKEGGHSGEEGHPLDSQIAWLRQLLDWKDAVADGAELVDHFRNDVFVDRIYVFTPKGQVIDLPQGATPLDFAYRVHTEVGHRCRGARVNGRMVSLNSALQTGECVEILTGKEAMPSRDWLNPHLGYLKTARARGKAQYWFRQLDRERNIQDGRQIVERELRRLGLARISRDDISDNLGYPCQDDFLLAVAHGECKMARFLAAAQALLKGTQEGPEKAQPLLHERRRDDHASGVQIQGVGNLLTHIARCCHPLPGDEICGYITIGRGVTIHRRDCANLQRCRQRQPQRVVDLTWGAEEKQNYPVDIEIKAFDRQGLLRDVSALLSDYKINLVDIRSHTVKRGHLAKMRLTVEVESMEALSRLLSRIAQLPNVLDVRRPEAG